MIKHFLNMRDYMQIGGHFSRYNHTTTTRKNKGNITQIHTTSKTKQMGSKIQKQQSKQHAKQQSQRCLAETKYIQAIKADHLDPVNVAINLQVAILLLKKRNTY
jgi:hypothetical protein